MTSQECTTTWTARRSTWVFGVALTLGFFALACGMFDDDVDSTDGAYCQNPTDCDNACIKHSDRLGVWTCESIDEGK